MSKRLERKQYADQPRPLFTARNIQYEMADRIRAVDCGGIGIWIIINTYSVYPDIPPGQSFFEDRFSNAVAALFLKRPHAFLVGGFTLVIALQFLSMGFLSLQNKRYFEELFHINTNILKQLRSK